MPVLQGSLNHSICMAFLILWSDGRDRSSWELTCQWFPHLYLLESLSTGILSESSAFAIPSLNIRFPHFGQILLLSTSGCVFIVLGDEVILMLPTHVVASGYPEFVEVPLCSNPYLSKDAVIGSHYHNVAIPVR